MSNADLDRIVQDALSRFEAVSDPAELEQIKARFLGKSGSITELLKGLGALPAEERRAAGARINAAKERIEQALLGRRDVLARERLQAKLREESIDVSLPGRRRGNGGIATQL